MKLPNTTTRLSKTTTTLLKRKDESMNNKTTSKLTQSTILGKAKFAVVAAATALSLAVVDADAQNVNIQNPNAIAGQVSWSSSANNWVFTAGNNSIIEFGAFNIYHGGSVQFIQPGANSAVLNRIIGADPSTINGGLSSNGRLFFVNPAGITFGANAVLNVGQIYAAAGSISNSDFLGGNYRFTNLDGTVKNLGRINASSGVALMGQHVINHGQIYAPGGFITLAAADKVILAPEGSGIIVQIDRTTSSGTSQAGIENTGLLKAKGGHVTAATGDLYSLAMDISGTIVAKDIHLQGGDDGIVKVSGNLNANGNSNGSNRGGKIVVEGEKVWLADGARLNATGKRGGGEILVGGDYQGKNNSIRNAWRTHVSQNVVLNASATQRGHGGKIIIWSDDFTNFFGTIKAKGAGRKGKGGFAEVSGKRTLGFAGNVNLRGSRGGNNGTLLLDPTDITITNASQGAGIAESGGDPNTFAEGGANNAADVSLANINTALATANVIITTASANAGNGDITWNATDPIVGGAGNSLTLTADRDILINAAIDFGTWTGDFNLSAVNNITIGQVLDRTGAAGNITAIGGGTVLVNAEINTDGGILTLDGATIGVAADLTAASLIVVATGNAGNDILFAAVDVNADSVNLTLSGGDTATIGYNAATSFHGEDTTGNPTTFSVTTTNNAGAAIDLDSFLAALGNFNDADLAGTAVTFENLGTADLLNNIGTLTNASLSLTTTGGDIDAALAASAYGNLTLATGGGDVTQTDTLTVTGTTNINAANITLTDATNEFVGDVTITAGTDASISDATNIQFAASTVGGDMAVIAVGDVTQSGNLAVTGTTNLAAANITLTDATNEFVGDVTITAGTDASISDATNIQFAASTVGGDMAVIAVGDVTQSGNLAVTGTTNLAAANITLTDATNEFVGDVTITAGTDASISDATNIQFAASTVGGDMAVIAVGDVTQSGNLAVTGTTNLAAANITLTDATNEFVDDVTITAGTDASISDATNIQFAASTVGGDMAVIAVGDVTQSGNLAVTGTTNLAAANITLTDATNEFVGDVTITAGTDASISDATNIQFAASTVGGDMAVIAVGDVTQSGNLAVTGTTNLAAANITLTDATNEFVGDVTITAGTDASISDATNIQFAASTVGGDMAVIAVGDVTQSGNLAVTGTTNLAAANITLTDATNEFVGDVTITAGTDASISDATNIQFAASTVGGDMAVIAVGDVTQSGNLAVTGTTNLAAANITLTDATNEFVGDVTITAGTDASISDATNIQFAASTVGGDMAVIAVGDVTQSGNLAVTGTTNLAAANITLTDATNEFVGDVTITAGTDASISDATNIQFAASTVGGDMAVIAVGDVTQSGNLAVTGTTNLAAANITLTDATNEFVGDVTITAGTDASISDATNIQFAASTVGGDMAVIAVGDVTQSGNLAVTGTTNLAAANITLTDATNEFVGDVTITAGTDASISDATNIQFAASTVGGDMAVIAVGDVTQSGNLAVTGTTNLAAANITLTDATNEFVGDVTITAGTDASISDATNIQFAASTVGGDMAVIAVGDVTQSGNLAVTGTTNLAAANITLTDATNEFVGDVTITAGTDASISDATNIQFAASTVGGDMAVIAVGDVTQSGNLAVTGTTNLAAANITLTDATNEFVGDVTITAGTDASISDATNIQFAASTVGGDMAVIAVGDVTQSGNLAVTGTTNLAAANITLTDATNEFVGDVTITAGTDASISDATNIQFAASTVGGDMAVIAVGDVTQSGNLAVTGTTNLAAANITLTDATNEFVGDVTITAGTDASISDATNIQFAASTVGGDMAVIAVGDVTQSGNLAVTGTTNLAAANITLTDATNEFVGDVTITAGTDASISDATNIQFAASTVGGDMAVIAVGDVTQSGNLAVTGTTNLAAANITLTDATNEFVGDVTITAGTDASISDATNIQFAASTVGGDMAVIAVGDVTQSGNLAVTGTTNLAAANITLTDATNEFVGDVTITAGTDASISDATNIQFAASTVGGDMAVIAVGDVTQSGNLAVTGTTNLAAANITLTDATNEFVGDVTITAGTDASISDATNIQFAASTVGGDMAVIAVGDVTQSGNLAVTGTTNLAAANITLTDATNEFVGDVTITAGTDASISDATNIQFAASTVGGDMAVIAVGDVTQSGNLAVTGTTNLAAANITLTDATNEFVGDVTITAGTDASISDATNIQFAASTVGGDMAVIAVGDVTQSGNLAVTGTTNLAAANITLTDATNEFVGDVTITAGTDASISDATNIQFAASTVGGDMAVIAVGDVTQSGNLAVTGTTNLAAANITLTDATNEFVGDVTITAGTDASISDATNIQFAASTVGGDMAVIAVGDVTQSGNLAVTGTTNLAAANITLTDATNEFVGDVTITAGTDASISDATNIQFAASTVGGDMAVIAVGDVTQSGNLAVTGTTNLAAANITLTDATNEFVGDVTITAGTDASISDATNIQFAASTVGGDMAVIAVGDVTQSGNLAVTGTTNLAAANITLTDATNEFVGDVTITAGTDASISDATNIQFAASTVGGDMAVIAVGDVTQSGNLAVTGTTNLAAANITLTDATNEFVGDVTITAGTDASISDATNIQFAASTVGGDMAVIAVGDVTQSGNLDVDGATDVDATNITLTDATNDFTGDVTITAGANASISDANDIQFGASTVGGDMTIIAVAGEVTDSGAIVVLGTTNVTALTDITLDDADNDFQTIELAGVDVDVTDVNGIDLGASTITGTFDLIAGGAVTDSDVVTIAGDAELIARGQSITLGTTDFASNIIVDTSGDIAGNGGNISITGDATGLIFTSINSSAFADGSNGGSIEVATGANLVINGEVNSSGGINGGAGNGGVGGDIDITGTTGVTFADGITITSSGGAATGAANNGGDGGAIIIQASNGNIITIGDNVTISAEGGASDVATGGDAANNGGGFPYTIQIGTVGSTTAIVVGENVVMSAAGGAGGAADGTTGTIYYGGAIELGGESDYIGDTNFGGDVTLASNSEIRVDGTLTFEATVDGQANDLLLSVSDIDIQAIFIDIPVFTLTGFAGTEGIGLGDAFGGTFTNNIGVSSAEIVFLENGGSGIGELQVGVKDFDVMNNTWALWLGDAAVATNEVIPFDVSVEQVDASGADIYWGSWDNGTGAGDVTVTGDVRIDGSGNTLVIAGVNTAASWSINDSIQVNADATIRSSGAAGAGAIDILGDHSISSFNADNNLIVEASDGNTITITDATFDAAAGSSIEDLTVQSKDSGGVDIVLNNLDGTITGGLVVQSDAAGSITLNTTGGDFTANLGMEFRDALVLNGATDLRSDGLAGSDIFFDGAITGAEALTLNTGALGSTTFSGDVTIDALTVTGALDIDGTRTVAITTAAIFNDTISGDDLTLTGDTVQFNGNVVNLNTIDVDTVTSTTIAAGIDFTTTDNITFQSALTVDGATTIESLNGTIDFQSTVGGGAADLILNSLTGGVIFSGDVLTINSLDVSGDTTINAANITATNDIDFHGTVDVTGSATVQSLATNVAMDSTVTGDAVGSLTVTGDNNVTISGTTSNFAGVTVTATNGTATIADVDVSGAIAITGATAITLTGSDYTTSDDSVTFTGDVSFADNDATVTSGGGAGDNIIFTNIVVADDLTLDSGATGTIAVAGTTTLNNLEITNSGGAIFTGAVTATTDITILDTTTGAAVSFLDTVTADDLVTTTTANDYLVSMTGTGNTFTQEVDFVNTGTVTLGDATADTFTFNNGLSFDGGAASNVAATITATGDANFGDGGVTLTDASVVTATGNISFFGILDGTVADTETLALDSGAGITFGDAVGAGISLGDVTVTDAANVTAAGTFAASSFTQGAGTGTTDFQGALTLTNNFNFTGNNLTLSAAGNDIGGDFGFINAGTFTITNAADLTVTGLMQQNGISTGDSSIGGDIMALDISFFAPGDVTLTDTVEMNATNNIIFGGALVGGGNDLTLGAGLEIDFQDTVLGIGTTTVTTAVDVTAQSTFGGVDYIQDAGTGTTDFQGALTLTNNFDFTGNNLTLSAAGNDITGVFDFENAGTFTITNAADLTVGSLMQQNQFALGDSSIGGNITANAISFFAPGNVTLTDTVAMGTTNDGAIIFAGALVGGGNDLTMDAGGGLIRFQDTVSGMGTTTVTSAGDVTVESTFSGVDYVQGAGTGTTDFQDVLTLTNNFNFTGNNLTLSAAGNDIGGDFGFINAGTFTITNAADLTVTGLMQQNGISTGDSSIGGDITANAISFFAAGNVTLTDTVAMDTTSGNGDMIFAGALLGGANDLTMDAGAGQIDFQNTVSGMGTTTVTNASNVTAQSTFGGVDYIQDAGTGTTDFQDVLTLTNNFTFVGTDLHLGDGAHSVGGAMGLTNAGTFTTDAAANVTVNGAFTQVGGGTNSLGGDITSTTAGIDFLNAVTLTDAVAMDSSGGGGAIVFQSTLNGTVADTQTLALDSGVGDITFGDAVGAGTRLGDVTVTDVATMNATSTFAANSFTQTAGSVATTFAGALDVTNAVTITDGTDVTFADTVNATEISQVTGSGTTTFNGAVTTSGANGVNVSNGVIALNASIGATTGTVDLVANTDLNIAAAGDITADGDVNLTGVADITTAGDVTTSGFDVNYNSRTTLSGDIAVDTGAGAGTITFFNTLDDDGGGNNLTLTAGTGDIDFDDVVGATRLGDVLVNSVATMTADGGFDAASFTQTAGSVATTFAGALDVTNAVTITDGTDVTFADTVNATEISQVAGSGTTTFNGAVTTDGGNGVNVTNDAIALNASIDATNGTVDLVADTAAVTIAAAGDITADGDVNLTGATGINTAGDVTTSDDNVNYNSVTVLSGNVAVDTGAGAGTVTFANTLDATAGENLTLTAGTGDIDFDAAVGTTRLGDVLVNSVATMTADAGFNAASFEQTAGSVATTFAGALDVTNAVTITDGTDVTFGSTVNATEISQVAGSGTTTFNGAVTTDGGNGVNVTNDAIALNASIDATNGTVDLVADTAAVTIAAAGDITADGDVNLTGATGINTAGDVTTSDDNVNYNSVTVLSGDIAVDTGAGAGTITFANTLDGTVLGTESLTLAAGAGDITFIGAVGGGVAVGDTTVVSAANVTTTDGLTAASLTVDATGTTSLTGDTLANGDIDVVSGVITAFNDVLSASGDISLEADTGALTLAAGTDVATLNGSIDLFGETGISLGANLVTDGNVGTITIDGDITLTDNIVIDTAPVDVAGAGDVTVTGDIDGAFVMTMDIEGDLSITGDVGSAIALTSIAGLMTGDAFVSGTIDSDGDIDLLALGDVTLGGDLTAGGDVLITTGAVGTIAFESNVSTVTAEGDIVLSNTAVSGTNVPAIATITAENTNGITFDAGDDFIMTAGEKLTAFDIDIQTGRVSGTGRAVLGDLVSLGDIRVTADDIDFISRDSAQVLTSDGTLVWDQGVDVVAAGDFFFSVAPTVIGGSGIVQFSSNNIDPDVNGTLSDWIVRWSPNAVTINSVILGDTVLDLRADGMDHLTVEELGALSGALTPMSQMVPIVRIHPDSDDDDEEFETEEEVSQEAAVQDF